jgi:hypothetical protein
MNLKPRRMPTLPKVYDWLDEIVGSFSDSLSSEE